MLAVVKDRGASSRPFDKLENVLNRFLTHRFHSLEIQFVFPFLLRELIAGTLTLPWVQHVSQEQQVWENRRQQQPQQHSAEVHCTIPSAPFCSGSSTIHWHRLRQQGVQQQPTSPPPKNRYVAPKQSTVILQGIILCSVCILLCQSKSLATAWSQHAFRGVCGPHSAPCLNCKVRVTGSAQCVERHTMLGLWFSQVLLA